MFHWITIILGIIFLTISLSNPFYQLTFNKFFKLNKFIAFIIRFFLFFFAIIIIFLGLYFESTNA